MSQSAGIAALITPDDIQRASEQPDAAHPTPILKVLAEARDNSYETVCLPLTTASWRARWRGMCLLPGGESREMDGKAEQQAENWRSQPAFQRDEVTVTRLGANGLSVPSVAQRNSSASCVDEAENVIALASEWLELDAEDAWVRHDAEVVRITIFSCLMKSKLMLSRN